MINNTEYIFIHIIIHTTLFKLLFWSKKKINFWLGRVKKIKSKLWIAYKKKIMESLRANENKFIYSMFKTVFDQSAAHKTIIKNDTNQDASRKKQNEIK